MTKVHEAHAGGLKIESLWVFISEDETGEGVCAFQGPDGMWMPLVAADEARLVSLRPLAKRLAAKTRKKIKLIRLTTREEIDEIQP